MKVELASSQTRVRGRPETGLVYTVSFHQQSFPQVRRFWELAMGEQKSLELYKKKRIIRPPTGICFYTNM